MRKISAIIAIAFIFCLPSSARNTQKAKLSNAGTAYIESSFGTHDAMQKEIHALAELGGSPWNIFEKMDQAFKGGVQAWILPTMSFVWTMAASRSIE